MAVHVCQSAVDPVVIIGQSGMVDSEQMKRCCMQVIAVCRGFDGFESQFIGCAESIAAPDSTTGHPCRESTGIVITAKCLASL